MPCPPGSPDFIIILNNQSLPPTFGGFFAPILRGAIHIPASNGDTRTVDFRRDHLASPTRLLLRQVSTCSGRKVAPRLFVDDWEQNVREFNNNLTRLPNCGWLRGSCNCFLRLLVCKLLNGKPKEGCNRLLARHLPQPPNPRPTRPLGSYSSPVAIGFSL